MAIIKWDGPKHPVAWTVGGALAAIAGVKLAHFLPIVATMAMAIFSPIGPVGGGGTTLSGGGCTSGQVVTNITNAGVITCALPTVAQGGTNATDSLIGPFAPNITTMICGGSDWAHPTATWIHWGISQAQTDNGTKSVQTCGDTTGPGSGNCIDYITAAATTGQVAGLTFLATETNQGWRWTGTIITEALTSRRIWVVLTTAAIGSHAPPTIPNAFATAKYMGAAWDSAVNSSKWLAVSGDGTTETGTDTGITATTTKTKIDIDCNGCSGGTPSFRVGIGTGGTALAYTSKSTNVSGSGNYGVTVFVETRANATARIQFPNGYSLCSYL